jgi:hypothetical protein
MPTSFAALRALLAPLLGRLLASPSVTRAVQAGRGIWAVPPAVVEAQARQATPWLIGGMGGYLVGRATAPRPAPPAYSLPPLALYSQASADGIDPLTLRWLQQYYYR